MRNLSLSASRQPLALFGDPLDGDSLMRMIYVDEAGRAANEPVLVVTALIVHSDNQWVPAAKRLEEVLTAMVPKHYRQGFVFHAKEIWGSPKYRQGWSEDDRKKFLCTVMSIPRMTDINIPVSLAYERRGSEFPVRDVPIPEPLKKLSKEDLRYAKNFAICMANADYHMRRYADPSEIAMVVADNIPEMVKSLRMAVKVIKETPDASVMARLVTFPDPGIGPELPQQLIIDRIVGQTHFADKRDEPLLQIVDAVAFGMRRFLAHQSTGDEFGESVVGTGAANAMRSSKAAPFGYGTFFPQGAKPVKDADKYAPPPELGMPGLR